MAKRRRSRAEEVFWGSWHEWKILPGTLIVRELRFSRRMWRFDFAWPDHMLAMEVEGRGRHQTYAGERADCEKYNAAASLGWRVLRYPAKTVETKPGEVIRQVERILRGIPLVVVRVTQHDVQGEFWNDDAR